MKHERKTTDTVHPKDVPAEDYRQGMFRDGKNRANATEDYSTEVPEDRIADFSLSSEALRASYIASRDEDEHVSPDNRGENINPARPTPRDTFHSRDGTDAAGSYDEEGGPLGGSEDELDDLEAGGTPVDRNPRMKD